MAEVQKTKVLQILEFIEANPDGDALAFRKQLGITGFDSYITHHLDHRHVIKTKVPGKSKRKYTYRMADGVTVEMIYEPGLSRLKKIDIQNKAEAADKSKTLKILEFIEQHPNGCHKAFRKSIGVLGFDAFLRNELKDRSVIKRDQGEGITYFLAPGLTAASIFKKRQEKTLANMETARQRAVEAIDGNASTKTEEVVPAFLKKDQQKPIPDADLLMAQELELPETYPVVKGTGRLRLSVSSDLTLTIAGKTETPVELTAEESKQLLDFIDGVSMLWPAL